VPLHHQPDAFLLRAVEGLLMDLASPRAAVRTGDLASAEHDELDQEGDADHR
jgi:hypothetical protein